MIGGKKMYTFPAELASTAASLRAGEMDLFEYINRICDRIEQVEPQVLSLLPETQRRERLLSEAARLSAQYPDPKNRPPLYGILLGVKDVFRVDGFPTRAGSRLDPELFAGPEAESVTILRRSGALVLGKTVTTEFAYFEPGPTRNPHNPAHTPGGSSSGSAAAVAAGFCQLALGTQTIASIVRPAAFCGIVGFKPSYGRISAEGLIYFSPSADHVGLFTQDTAGAALAASLLCRHWQPPREPLDDPVLAVPEGPYLDQAPEEALQAFSSQINMLRQAGYRIVHIPVFEEIELIARRHRHLISAEIAQVHAAWFPRHEQLYRSKTVELIREGLSVSDAELAEARQSQMELRNRLDNLLREAGADLWVAPSTSGPAPKGIEYTGDPAMGLPWTHSGLPSISLPAGRSTNGLPLGLQLVAPFMADEKLLHWACRLDEALEYKQ